MNNDLISREDAINAACDAIELYSSERDAVADEIYKVEAVDAEPVRYAKWVWDNDAVDWNLGAWICSNCRNRNENIHAGKPGTDKILMSNPYIWSGSQYCPNCGAKMDGKDGDNGV